MAYPPLLKQGRCLGDDVIVIESKEPSHDTQRKKKVGKRKAEERKRNETEMTKKGREKFLHNIKERSEEISMERGEKMKKKVALGDDFNLLDVTHWPENPKLGKGENEKIETMKRKMFEKKISVNPSDLLDKRCSFHTQFTTTSTSLASSSILDPPSSSLSSALHSNPVLSVQSAAQTSSLLSLPSLGEQTEKKDEEKREQEKEEKK